MINNYFSLNMEHLANSYFKSFYVFIFLLVSAFSFGQTVTIGSGTNVGNKLPVSTFYNYSFSEQIIPQAEINTAGLITRIRFYRTNTSITNSNEWTIYLGHTTKTAFVNNTDWILAGAMTQVFSGTLPGALMTGWMEITLTTPFNYNNVDNLVVAVDENVNGNNGSANSFRIFTSAVANSAIYYDSDSVNPDPSDITLTGTRPSYRSQIQLAFTPLVACSGTPLGGTVTVNPTSGSPGSTYGVSATGYTNGTGLTYQWQFSDNGGGTWSNQGTAISYSSTLSGMVAGAFGSIRTWRLVVTCTDSGLSGNSSTGTFTSSYCVPSGTTSYYITNFSTTGGITNIAHTTGNSNIYGNHSTISASQYPGSSIDLSISTSSSTHYFYGWVDWNNDGDFLDANEAIFSTTTYSAGYTGSLLIPLTQPAGSYRMRIANSYLGSITSCSAGG